MRSHVVLFHLYEMPKTAKSTEKKVAQGLPNVRVDGISFQHDENFLKLHCGDGCKTLNILKITKLYTSSR